MTTNYLQEIESLLSKIFTPSTAAEEKAEPKTLEEIQTMVINVLPAKWIYDTDIHTALQNLGFTTSYGKKDDAFGLFYFVLINK